ncbi:heparinase II/III family protein [uncultured Lutibacter sp.]|uniref:heparinase II/III family protein n=1 Tax=uncultured Lutibacter sp. TaxID=437739 RepID=UPI002624F355|nr:heparinase II/III family protein [uncultured Lutibacter sp.]
MKIKILSFCSYLFFCFSAANAQQIPTHKVVSTNELFSYLKEDIRKELKNNSIENLASYFREKYSERYFYDWKNFEERFENYNKWYNEQQQYHTERAKDHLTKFSDSTHWKLPFNYLNNEPVNAYALRHLARQHKMVDIAYYYYYSGKDSTYIKYFKNQLKSLNDALSKDKYEKIKDGNGVYEAFRSGYRVLNWLQIHNMFLSQESYSNEDQLKTIATLLQHGAHLYLNNQKFHAGNHQTRGLSALAMISILLRDFNETEVWYEHSMNLLAEHLQKEINEDGFQFERSVHYHMSDIGNFYYVYALAKKSNLHVKPVWEQKLKSLFTTLTKIAYPNKFAPVLQDDTDIPWAERNDISEALTLGYLLFEDPELGYFSNEVVDPKMFWYVNEFQLQRLQNIDKKQPRFKSLNFPQTHYYVMRQGWEKNDKMMIISAGVDKYKPDHQHGDILGLQAMANEQVILPNYQVRYSLKDLELFKNSMVKNVALVDNELQGKHYASNKGGSGFGKFRALPKPETVAWKTSDKLDLFVGHHNGFENVGVDYSRQVIYVKDDFWIVKDNFSSGENHNYKQVWQGHYSLEHQPNLLRSTFENGSGLDIYQLNFIDAIKVDGARGKEWVIVEKKNQQDFSFLTILYPFTTYDKRIDEEELNPTFLNWKQIKGVKEFKGENLVVLNKVDQYFAFSVSELNINNYIEKFKIPVDLYVEKNGKQLKVQLLSDKSVEIRGEIIQPGEFININL